MLQAVLKGKLKISEDILTSIVFGLLRYVQPRQGILQYLGLTEDEDGKKPLNCLSSLSEVPQESIEIEYQFWPRWKEPNCYGCEPDVVISLKIPDKQDLLVLIEAKFSSGKSSEADESHEKPNDQLAKEWDNLSVIAKRLNKKPVIIYLTAHYAYPHQDIDDAVSEFQEKRPESATPDIYWLSWRHLYKVCENKDNLILNDLRLLLDRYNLEFFDGIKLEDIHIPWSFEKVFNWQKYTGVQKINWRFKS